MSFTFAKPGGKYDRIYRELLKRDGLVFWQFNDVCWSIRVWRLEFLWAKKVKR